jgi:hypothetical protein
MQHCQCLQLLPFARLRLEVAPDFWKRKHPFGRRDEVTALARLSEPA